MSNNSNSVKKHPETPRRGDLRPVLLRAATELLDERGVDGFSLRETARRAGVSPAAHAYYFKDTRALLTAVATDAFRELGSRLATAASSAPGARAERIAAQAGVYVAFAIATPARFDLMWRKALLDTGDAEFKAAADAAFLELDRLVRGPGARAAGKSDALLAPTIAWWSLVHGFAKLANEGAFGDAAEAAERLLPAILDHLDAPRGTGWPNDSRPPTPPC